MAKTVAAVLLDLDGVFYVGDRLLEGGVETLDMLRRRGIPYRFITNTTTRSCGQLLDKLQGLGLPAAREDLMTAPLATRSYLEREGLERCYFAVADAIAEDFQGLEHTEKAPDAVVLGDIGDAWDYELLDKLFGYLVDGARLVAMHRNRYWQKAGGLHVDIGLFVAGLEYVADTEAVITGKPANAFFDAALRSMGAGSGETLLVGDDIHSDIGGAQRAGLRGVLVKTGKYREALVRESGIEPDWIIDSIAGLEECFQES